MRIFLDKSIETINSIYNEALENIKKLLIENNCPIELPFELEEYCNTAIAYNGGNHPEYASNCFARVEKIEYDHNYKQIIVHFEDGTYQDLRENSTVDVLSVLEMILTYKENF